MVQLASFAGMPQIVPVVRSVSDRIQFLPSVDDQQQELLVFHSCNLSLALEGTALSRPSKEISNLLVCVLVP